MLLVISRYRRFKTCT